MLRISEILKGVDATTIPRLDAELLLAHALHRDRVFILSYPTYRLSLIAYFLFHYFLFLRKHGIPLAYITHHKEFYGLDFFVNKHTLVPRPETELLVEEVLKKLKEQGLRNKEQTITLIDVGTGSGCIPIAIGKTMRQRNNGTIKIFATDISKQALYVAKKNAQMHNVPITFFQGDLLESIMLKDQKIKNKEQVIITANLPYGWKEWKNNSSAETRGLRFEPSVALFTGDGGLELIKRLLLQMASSQLFLGPYSLVLYLEFDPRQTSALKKAIAETFPTATCEIKKDLAGHDRLAIVHLQK